LRQTAHPHAGLSGRFFRDGRRVLAASPCCVGAEDFAFTPVLAREEAAAARAFVRAVTLFAAPPQTG
jgi:hypothetical protein